jgi:4-hydroxy-2-oxoheptanedioate aldolase
MTNDGAASKEGRKRYDMVSMTGDTKAIQNWYIAELELARS